MSGYREAPREEQREELPDFRPKGIERALKWTWTAYLVWPIGYVLRDRQVGGWLDLREELVFWATHSPVAIGVFVAWWLLRRFRGPDASARRRFERAEPRFDPPRKDIL